MKSDILNKLWENQQNSNELSNVETIIAKASVQRKKQNIGITIMAITLTILCVYAVYYLPSNWSNFSLGLVMMIGSLAFRIVLEFIFKFRKGKQLVNSDNISFKAYLINYYKIRQIVHYAITPICYGIYIYGFTLLLPYFKEAFSKEFYLYIIISGLLSFVVIGAVIVKNVIQELKEIKELNAV